MANQPNFDLATSIFPPPPAYYKAFTDVNVARYAELRAQAGEASGTSKNRAAGPSSHERPSDEVDGDEQMTQDLSESEKEELRELQGLLEKPRADWVREGGAWMSFGQRYDVEARIPTASDIGLPTWVDPDKPPQETLPPVLHSFLHTFLLLLDTLTNTARIPGELEQMGWAHEGDQYVQHMSNLAATMMVSANQLRDVQAEATLILLLERELTLRKEQTLALRTKSQAIRETLQKLRVSGRKAAESSGESLR